MITWLFKWALKILKFVPYFLVTIGVLIMCLLFGDKSDNLYGALDNIDEWIKE